MKRFILVCMASIMLISALLPIHAVASEILTPADLAKELTFRDDGMSCVAEYFEDCDQFVIALLPDFTDAEWLASDSSLRSDYMASFDSICNRVVAMLDSLGYAETVVIGLMMTTDPEFIAFSVDGHNLQDVIG